jgi:putative ABC transport system substrate-binding protein
MKRREFITLLGGAAAWPLTARAQQAMPVVGFLSSRSANDSLSVEAAFHRGLGETGYVEGRNARIAHRWADGRFERLPALAAELVEQRVSVIAAVGGDITVHAVKAATTTIPIVMVAGDDPAKTGLVASLARPGSNITGVTLFSVIVEQKRLDLLQELVSAVDILAVLLNPRVPNYEARRIEIEAAAQTLGQKIRILDASTEREIETAFAALVQMKAGGLFVGTSPFFSSSEIKSSRWRCATGCRRSTILACRSKLEGLSVMVPATPIPIVRRASTSDGYSRVRDRPICRFCSRPNSNW